VIGQAPDPYIGRFAPSPTGPLHFGSLLAAVASYLQARTNNGRWLVRIEDIDPPREQAGADQLILDALQSYGFEWDDRVSYQSESANLHQAAVDDFLQRKLAYPCLCSRRMLKDVPVGALGPIYPGTCRDGCSGTDVAIRVRTDNEPIEFEDGLQGPVVQRLESESGDFVIKRRDGLIAYHLAVVVDDQQQGISEIVRGVDLLDSTPRQIHLQRLLGFRTPDYLHIPVATNRDGQKLSKLTGASGIALDAPRPTLVAALATLRQAVTPELEHSTLSEIWDWATTHWNPAQLCGLASVPDEQDSLATGKNGLR
jgi:glutamyl-Q tRNA(Asp) synthetase